MVEERQCWENWTATCGRMKLEYSLTPYIHKNKHKMDYRPIKVRPDNIKLIKENKQNTLNIN